MRDTAIKKVVSFLEEKGIALSQLKALDFFAREGDWQTAYYAPLVKEIHAWELNPDFETNLKKNLPLGAKVTIGDSHVLAKETNERFDLIVLDNPLGCYADKYCEHFNAIECIVPLLNDFGIVVLNVKTQPYNFEKFPEWKRRRDDFYGVDSSSLSDHFIDPFYREKFSTLGFNVDFSLLVKRPQEENLYEYVIGVRRNQLESH